MATKYATHKDQRGAFTKGVARKNRNRARQQHAPVPLTETARAINLPTYRVVGEDR